MNKEMLKEAGIDYDQGVARCVGNSKLYESLLLRCTTDSAPIRAEQFYIEKDFDKLFEVVHEVKGVSGNLCMETLFSVTSKLTEVLRNKDYKSENFEELYKQFHTALIATADAIMSASEG